MAGNCPSNNEVMKSRTKRKLVFGVLLLLIAVLLVDCIYLSRELSRVNQLLQSYEEAAASGDAAMAALFTAEELETAKEQAYEEGQKDILETLQANLIAQGASVLRALKPLYPNKILLYNSDGYHFVDIDGSLAQHNYSDEALSIDEESGIYSYDDGNVVGHKCIDVSTFQGNIDWNAVAGGGVEYAFIRALYRGYGTGVLKEDESFAKNMSGSLAAGIQTGIYVFSQAITEEELIEEANAAIEMVKPYSSDCIIVYDVEKIKNGRMNELSVEERTRLTKLFCDTVAAAGYQPMIYYNTEMSVLYLDLAELGSYDKWFAAYTDEFYYPYEYKVWQYSESGHVAGINSEVDLDLFFTEK